MVRWKPIPEWLYGKWGSDEKGFRDFVATFGFNRYARVGSETIANIGKFLRADKRYSTSPHHKTVDSPPDFEHAMVFTKAGTGRRMLVYHPYIPNFVASTPNEFKRILEAWCNSRGIIYVLCPKSRSFYNPGGTYMVLLMSEDTYIECLSIPAFPQEFGMQERSNKKCLATGTQILISLKKQNASISGQSVDSAA